MTDKQIKPVLGLERLRAEVAEDKSNAVKPKACTNYLQCIFPSLCTSTTKCQRLERSMNKDQQK